MLLSALSLPALSTVCRYMQYFCPDARPVSTSGTAGGLPAKFQELVEIWRRDTMFLSFMQQRALHPAYQRIIGMGLAAVPLILEELQREPNQWFWALEAITEENPVPPESAGDVRRMARAWIDWGRQRGYLGS